MHKRLEWKITSTEHTHKPAVIDKCWFSEIHWSLQCTFLRHGSHLFWFLRSRQKYNKQRTHQSHRLGRRKCCVYLYSCLFSALAFEESVCALLNTEASSRRHVLAVVGNGTCFACCLHGCTITGCLCTCVCVCVPCAFAKKHVCLRCGCDTTVVWHIFSCVITHTDTHTQDVRCSLVKMKVHF